MNKDTSGPAFPINANESADRCIYTGMTLRDYFAAKAMQGMMADALAHNASEGELAVESYKMADAMLRAREK